MSQKQLTDRHLSSKVKQRKLKQLSSRCSVLKGPRLTRLSHCHTTSSGKSSRTLAVPGIAMRIRRRSGELCSSCFGDWKKTNDRGCRRLDQKRPADRAGSSWRPRGDVGAATRHPPPWITRPAPNAAAGQGHQEGKTANLVRWQPSLLSERNRLKAAGPTRARGDHLQ